MVTQPNGISIGLAVFAGLTKVANRQTDIRIHADHAFLAIAAMRLTNQ